MKLYYKSDFKDADDQRTQWLEMRKDCIGGSDISIIYGCNPWRSEFSLYLEKNRLDFDKESTLQMRLGQVTEEGLIKLYCEMNDCTAYTDTVCIIKSVEGLKMMCSPDAMLDNAILEIKHLSFGFDDEWTDRSCPENYYLQCQWYMHVTGVQKAVLFAASNSETRTYNFEYDDKLCEELEQKAVAWWHRHVILGESPEPTAADNGLMSSVYEQNTDDIALADDSLSAKIEELINVRAELKTLENLKDALEAIIKQRIGDGAGITDGRNTITWKQAKPTTTVDWQEMAYELGVTDALVTKYSKAKPGSRRFLIKKELMQ